MEKIINKDNLRSFAYTNEDKIAGEIKGVVVEFFGLGFQNMFEDLPQGNSYAEKGLLFVVPYTNPWGWMNRSETGLADEIIDVLFEKLSLPQDIPLIYTGGSMGGLGGIVYTKYSKRTPASCVVSCPVCDLPYHYTERPDLPRTLYSAFYDYDGSFDEALKSASPIHLAHEMPKSVSYHIIHCDEDKSVNIDRHSKIFVSEMKKYGYDITFDICRGRDHCDLSQEMKDKYFSYIFKASKIID